MGVNILEGIKMSTNNAQSKKESYNPFAGTAANPFQFMDAGAAREQWNKNMQTMNAANQVARDCATEVSRRMAELWKKNGECIQECYRDALSSRSPQEAHSRQSEAMSSVVSNCTSYSREMADISSKATREILDICNQSMSEVLSGFQNNSK